MRVMTELDVMSLWRRPAGYLDRKLCALIALGCAVTLAVTTVGPRWFWHAYGDGSVRSFWIHDGLAVLVGAILFAALLLRGTSPSLRLALALPLSHVAATAVAWSTWTTISPRLADARDASPVLHALPMGPLTLGALALCALAGRAVARRRDWVHGMVVMALASLLAVGLWLPIAASWYCRNVPWLSWQEVGEAHPYRIAAFVLVPAIAAAFAYTLIVMRAPATTARRLRGMVAVAVPLAFVGALAARSEPTQIALAMYGNFVHVLLALTITSVGAIAALGLALLARARRAQRMLKAARTGTITCDGTALALELPSWLRGPRLVSQAFTIETARESLIVPAGVEIHARIPGITTQLGPGEALELARSGDQVLVAGFVEPDPAHPFRGSLAALPGPDGLVVARAGDTAFGDADVALALWRPCVAYLVIGIAVALPALVSALTMR